MKQSQFCLTPTATLSYNLCEGYPVWARRGRRARDWWSAVPVLAGLRSRAVAARKLGKTVSHVTSKKCGTKPVSRNYSSANELQRGRHS